jgi:hypothetical protein
LLIKTRQSSGCDLIVLILDSENSPIKRYVVVIASITVHDAVGKLKSQEIFLKHTTIIIVADFIS